MVFGVVRAFATMEPPAVACQSSTGQATASFNRPGRLGDRRKNSRLGWNAFNDAEGRSSANQAREPKASPGVELLEVLGRPLPAAVDYEHAEIPELRGIRLIAALDDALDDQQPGLPPHGGAAGPKNLDRSL